MSIEQEIRNEIDNIKQLKIDVGDINNHLSVLEGLCRERNQEAVKNAYQRGYKACMQENDFDSPCTSCEAYKRGLEDGKKSHGGLLADASSAEYQRRLDDTWAAAKKVVLCADEGGLSIEELNEIFDCCTIQQVFRKYTVSEVIEKLKAYEEKQKASQEIKVGDEVAFHHDDGRPDTVVVVTYIGQDGFIDGMDGRGAQYAHKNPTKWTKTGRHFDIDKILEEMKK